MKKKLNLFLLPLVFLLIAVDCREHYTYLNIANKTSNKLYVYCDATSPQVKDTIIVKTTNHRGILEEVRAKGEYKIYIFPDSWESAFQLKDTIRIFVFHADTVDKYPWEVIRKEYKILKRYDLTKKDVDIIKQNGNTLVYP